MALYYLQVEVMVVEVVMKVEEFQVDLLNRDQEVLEVVQMDIIHQAMEGPMDLMVVME